MASEPFAGSAGSGGSRPRLWRRARGQKYGARGFFAGVGRGARAGIRQIRRRRLSKTRSWAALPPGSEIKMRKVQGSPQKHFPLRLHLRGHELSVQVADDLENNACAGHPAQKLTPRPSGGWRKRYGVRVFSKCRMNTRSVLPTSGPVGFAHHPSPRGARPGFECSGTGSLPPPARIAGRVRPERTGLAALALTFENCGTGPGSQGRGLYDQRLVKNENLALAIRALQEAERPGDHPAGNRNITRMPYFVGNREARIDEIVKNHEFRPIAQSNSREWAEAANQLRTICDACPTARG